MDVLLAQSIGSGAMVVALMLALGLKLEPKQLLALWERRTMLAASIFVNVVVVPLLAIAAARLFELPPYVAIGLVLCCAAPGGPTAALYSNLSRGDLPFTAAMTIVLPAIGVVSAPLFLSFAADLPSGESVPILPMIVTLVVLEMVPLLIGMWLRKRFPERAPWLAKQATRVANVFLAALVIGLLIAKGKVLLEIDVGLWAAIVIVCALTVGLGLVAAGKRPDTRRAGILVAISRNVATALLLASTFFKNAQVDATVLAFGFVTFLLPVAFTLRWKSAPAEPEADLVP